MRFLFAFVFLFNSCLVLADDAALRNQGAKLLPLKSFESLEGRFVQVKTLSELGVELKTEGHFTVHIHDQKSPVFHWNVEKPKASQVCLDSVGVTIKSSGQSKRILFSEIGSDSSDQMKSLLKLMSLDPHRLGDDFQVVAQGARYLLSPKNPQSVFFKSALIHIGPLGIVDEVEVNEKSQDKLKIEFSKLKTQKTAKPESCAI